MLRKTELDQSIAWLTAKASAPVKYLTQIHLLGVKPDSCEAEALWENVEMYDHTREIFSKQAEDGSWCAGGSWAPKPSYLPGNGYTPVSPKYVTTVWLLSLLGDMGYTVRDRRIEKACEWTLGWQLPNGILSEKRGQLTEADYTLNPRNVPCRMSIQLAGLTKVDAGKDLRVRKALDLLIRWQREDHGWLHEGHRDGTSAPYEIWDRSCPWSTFFSVTALFNADIPYRQVARSGLDFLLWHLDRKTPDQITQFFWHGHEPVKELLMLSEMGYDPGQKSIQLLLDWLEGMRDPTTGSYLYKGKSVSKMSRREDGGDPRVMRYRLYHLIEADWLTYWATRIISNFM